MTPELLVRLVIRPVVEYLKWPQTRERMVLLTAIALQESALKHRRQMPSGPARSWWQIEPETCLDCLERCSPVRGLHSDLGLRRTHGVSRMLELSDIGACAIAAGILRLTPGRLPEVGDVDGAWRYYLASWRPGEPRPDSWPKAYNAALQACSTEWFTRDRRTTPPPGGVSRDRGLSTT